MLQSIRACQTLHKSGKKTPTTIEEVSRTASKAVTVLRHPRASWKEARRGVIAPNYNNGTLEQQREGNITLRTTRAVTHLEQKEREMTHFDQHKGGYATP